jgi:translation initiation factor 2 beta subunit (eIF-2beta)/eIF-5
MYLSIAYVHTKIPNKSINVLTLHLLTHNEYIQSYKVSYLTKSKETDGISEKKKLLFVGLFISNGISITNNVKLANY